MENRREERIQQLLHALQGTDKIHLKQAAQLLDVSEMTIRRDLSTERAPIALLGGYLVMDPKNSAATHYLVSAQQWQRSKEKKRIAALAAPLICDDDVVFFDCGTTIPYLIEAIADECHFTAICFSLNTFLALQEKSNCNVILCGGEFHPGNMIFTPLNLASEVTLLRPHKAFISAAGITLRHGATCFNFNELGIKHAVLENAQQAILVADSSKFDRVRPAAIAPLSRFHRIITDLAPAVAYCDYFAEQGIELFC